MTDPNANPDVLHVDGPTRDAIIEALKGEVARGAGFFAAAADFIESRFPVSAEPPNTSKSLQTFGGSVSAEPSPNPLREFVADLATEDEASASKYMAVGAILLAREALATDQSQSDRTSDEATPAEPVYEWRAVTKGGWGGPIGSRADVEAWRRYRDNYPCLERRTPGTAPGPWERVDDGGRRDG